MTLQVAEGAIVHNRSRFLGVVAGLLAALPSPFPDLAVLSISLPGMAAFQQTYGVSAADQLWHRIHAALRRFAPESVFGRIADGQFAMTYEFDSAWTNVEEVASDLRAVIGGSSNGKQLSLVAPPNLGAVVRHGKPPLGTSLEVAAEMLRQANLAVEIASQPGRDGFMLYSAAASEQIRSNTILDHALRRAVADHQFRLHYQPLVDLRTLEMVGLEGLVRWQDPAVGLRGPNDFIPAAESSGLIVQLGAEVIDIAMQQVDAWMTAGWAPPRVAVNVAAPQLQDPGFRDTVLRAVSCGRVNPANLELEMTERTLITWSNSTRRLLDELREMGITLALDDFGTGYSSLQYLRDMPLSKLKIDRAFIRRIATDRRDAALVKTIVGLGDALDLDIVAEGIEEREQAEAVLDCGCTIGQGYLFSRPQPPADLPALQAALRRRHQEAPLHIGDGPWRTANLGASVTAPQPPPESDATPDDGT